MQEGITGMALPLATHRLLETYSVDEAREAVGRVLAPHDLAIRAEARRFHARQHGVRLGRLALSRLEYGAEVRITPHRIDGFYLFHIPLAGAVEVTGYRECVTVTSSQAVVAQPDEPFVLNRWHADVPMLLVWFDAEGLHQTLWRVLGEQPRAPLRFNLRQDLTTPAMQGWIDLVRAVCTDVDGGRALTHPTALSPLEQLLATGLLLSSRHSYTALLHDGVRPALPRRVRAAIVFMRANAREPIGIVDIAAACGVGVRALQLAFRRHLDTTPLAYLRQVRLDGVRAELERAGPGPVSVTDVAIRWGLALGRFAELYRTAFGESPSETLRRGR